MIVCICHNVSERKIREAVEEGVVTMPQLRDCLRIGTCCGKCHPHAKQVLRECIAEAKACNESQPIFFQHAALAA